jgi:hypothetical protein
MHSPLSARLRTDEETSQDERRKTIHTYEQVSPRQIGHEGIGSFLRVHGGHDCQAMILDSGLATKQDISTLHQNPLTRSPEDTLSDQAVDDWT